MDHHPHHHIADALEATSAHPAQSRSPDELIIAMSDLATIAGLLGQLATQTRRHLAAWATVEPHLHQAEQHASDLSRSLRHACGTFAYANPSSTAA
ncbi:MAG TPA: hypothetical protein VE196_12015 [Pseudonocardiaceae bacterium]|nr:hypothetical protein [Pseudonocardiaceae bacterium]